MAAINNISENSEINHAEILTKNISMNSGIDNQMSSILKLVVRHLKQEHNLSANDIFSIVKTEVEDITIPLSIFNKKLSPLVTITKYLVEVRKLKKSQIAKILNRNPRTISSTYKKSVQKDSQEFVAINDTKYNIPASEFSRRDFSSLEIIVRHLKENCDISFSEIAKILSRDYSTIWTSYNRAIKKLAK